MNRLSRIVVALALAWLGVPSAQATASMISVSGAGNILVPNASPNTGMTADFFNDTVNVLIHGWNELQNVTLGTNITVDIVSPGLYGTPFTSANAVIAAGTRISSHYFYQDPLNLAASVATFEFDADIIGIIVLSDLAGGDRLLNTDFLRNPLTVAPGVHFPSRGIEFGPETVLLNVGLRTITLNLESSSPGDQLRVITRAADASVVPEPTSLLLLGTGVAGLVAKARRRKKQNAANI